MADLVLVEHLGGRVLVVDRFDDPTLAAVGDGRLTTPSGPAVDHATGSVLVAQPTAHRVALAGDGGPWRQLGSGGSGRRRFRLPTATAFLADGRMLVLDAGNGRLVAFDAIDGTGWTTFGRRGRPSEGEPAVGRFADPRGLAVDHAGRIWVADPGAGRLVRFDDLDGDGWVDLPLPPAARPALPYGLAAHGDGVAVVDVGNRRVALLDGQGTHLQTVELGEGSWVSPAFVASRGDDLVVGDAVANEVRLLRATDDGGFEEAERLRGHPPDLRRPRFDSVGGLGS